MFCRKKMIFPVLALLFLSTACAALRSMDGASPEEMKKSELSKDDLWDLTKTLEKEKAIGQKQLAEQEGLIARLNGRLSSQQSETLRAHQQVSELKQVVDDLSAKLRQHQEAEKKRSSQDWTHRALTEAWGTIMYARDRTNILTKRSVDSKPRGMLIPGQTVKADFLKDDWYAVFKITETERAEKNALGYVHAPRLFLTAYPEKAPEAVIEAAKEIFSVSVNAIRHRVQPGGKEVLLVEFDRFYVPAVYNIEGDSPVIIMDVTRTSSMKKEWSEIRTKGTLIRMIRVTPNPAAGILRIVLHMTPDRDYDIKPTFYAGKENKVYALEVTGVVPVK
jgi:uncharacterized coiled-coil protein SlyX